MPLAEVSGQLFLTLVSVFSALMAVPLTVLVFHLRAVRGDQAAKHREMDRWSEWMQREVNEARRMLQQMPADYAGKEEWLRETMRIRQAVERMSETIARHDVRIQDLVDHCRTWGSGCPVGTPRMEAGDLARSRPASGEMASNSGELAGEGGS